MSAAVDVLAVMGGYCDLSTEMREARAAVAELIDAASHLRETRTYKGTADAEARRARLDAALARVRGGAA